MSVSTDFAAVQQAVMTAQTNAATNETNLAAAQAQIASLNGALATASEAATVNAGALAAANASLQAEEALLSAGPTKHWVGVNLDDLQFYDTNRMFADAMLTAQNFYSGDDANGNPTVDQAVIVMDNLNPSDIGVYQLVAQGNLVVTPSASYCTVSGLQYNATTNQTTAQVTITAPEVAAANQLALHFGNVASGGVHTIQLYRPGANIGDRYYGPAAKSVAPFKVIRFMDFLATNNSTLTDFSQRPQPTARTYSNTGGCYEDALGFAKFCGKDPWINIPASANAQWATNLIHLIRQNTSGPVYIEFGNENWNADFAAYTQGMAASKADPSLAFDGTGDPNILLWRWMGKQAALIGEAAMAVYGVSDIRLCPIRPVLCGQWGNPSVLQYATQFVTSQIGPIQKYIYGLAIAPYITCGWDVQSRLDSGDATVTIADVERGFTEGATNPSLSNSGTAAFIALCKQLGMVPLAYEFGPDDGQSQSDVPVKIAAAGGAGMGLIMTTGINNWFAAGAQGLNWFTLSSAWNSNGQWGMTSDMLNTNTPKYQAVAAAAMATL